MANQMLLTPKDLYEGQLISDIRWWSTEQADDQKVWKGKKKEISLWNKLAKQIHLYNPWISENWLKYKNDRGSYNHIVQFINMLKCEVINGVIEIEEIHKITEEDNGSRGLARSMDLLAFNEEGKVIYLRTIHMNAFYYM